jgi:hypothetical protein
MFHLLLLTIFFPCQLRVKLTGALWVSQQFQPWVFDATRICKALFLILRSSDLLCVGGIDTFLRQQHQLVRRKEEEKKEKNEGRGVAIIVWFVRPILQT